MKARRRGGAGVMMRSLHRGSVPLSALGTEVLQSADRGRTSSGARLESAERQRRTSAPHQSAVRRATPSSSRNDRKVMIRTVHFQSLSDSTPSQNSTEEFSKPHRGTRYLQSCTAKCSEAVYSGTLPNLTKPRVVAGRRRGHRPRASSLPYPHAFSRSSVVARNGMQSGARVELRSQSDLNQPSPRRPKLLRSKGCADGA